MSRCSNLTSSVTLAQRSKRPAVDQHIECGYRQRDGIADEVGPSRGLSAHKPVSQEIDQPHDCGHPTHDDPDGDQPGGEIRPLHCRGSPVHEIGEKRADEAGNGDGNQHRMDGMAANAGSRMKSVAHRDALRDVTSVGNAFGFIGNHTPQSNGTRFANARTSFRFNDLVKGTFTRFLRRRAQCP